MIRSTEMNGSPEIWDELRYFEKREFDCPCCGKNEMQPAFLRKLDRARHDAGFPFVVTSGYRCPDYNDEISSTGKDGPHTTGRATDVHVVGNNARRLVRLAEEFTGIGIHQRGPHRGRFIHLDDLQPPNHPRPWVWSY